MQEIPQPGNDEQHELPDIQFDFEQSPELSETPTEVATEAEPTEQSQELPTFDEMVEELSGSRRQTTEILLGFLAVHSTDIDAENDSKITTADLARVIDPSPAPYPLAKHAVEWLMKNDLVRYGEEKTVAAEQSVGRGGRSLIATEHLNRVVEEDENLTLRRDFFAFGNEQGLTDPNEIQRRLLDIAQKKGRNKIWK